MVGKRAHCLCQHIMQAHNVRTYIYIYFISSLLILSHIYVYIDIFFFSPFFRLPDWFPLPLPPQYPWWVLKCNNNINVLCSSPYLINHMNPLTNEYTMHVKYECDNDTIEIECAKEKEKKRMKERFKSRKYYLMLHCIVLLMLIHIEAHRFVYFNTKCNWCFDTNTHTQAFTIFPMLMIYDLSSFTRKSTVVFDVQCRIPLNMESLEYIAWCNISSYEVIFYLFVPQGSHIAFVSISLTHWNHFICTDSMPPRSKKF